MYLLSLTKSLDLQFLWLIFIITYFRLNTYLPIRPVPLLAMLWSLGSAALVVLPMGKHSVVSSLLLFIIEMFSFWDSVIIACMAVNGT